LCGTVTGLDRQHGVEPARQRVDLGEEPIVLGLHAGSVVESPLFYAHRRTLAALALQARLPAIYGTRAFADDGGLMSYGASQPDLFRRAAGYMHKILQGTKPADLPVEQPVKFDLVVNLRTAKALGLTVPESFLLRADEVIE
jgi:putative ABC transport system substrate-binding protein